MGAHAPSINWNGSPHIIAFTGGGILAAAIFLGSIIVRQAAAQVKEAACLGGPFARLSLACSCAKRQVSHQGQQALKTARDDSVQAFAAR
jgi:hypothetical protein